MCSQCWLCIVFSFDAYSVADLRLPVSFAEIVGSNKVVRQETVYWGALTESASLNLASRLASTFLFLFMQFNALKKCKSNSPWWVALTPTAYSFDRLVVKMNWNPHMDVQYMNSSYPYNSAGSFMEYFEGLTYEHVNFIFDGASHVQVP